MAEETEPQPCHLFGLSPELRNRIYRLVVLKPTRETIKIKSDGYDRPGLLKTCKQIRSEALKIFHYENEFFTMIKGLDSDTMIKYTESLGAIGIDWRQTKILRSVSFTEVQWTKLVEWVQRYYARRTIPAPTPSPTPSKLLEWADPDCPGRDVVGSMFVIAKKLRSQPWTLVKEILDEMRPGLIATDERWVKD